MGLAPDLLPGRVSVGSIGCANLAESWGDIPTVQGKDTRQILEGLDAGDIRCLFLVGSDPIRDMPEPSAAIDGLHSAEFVVSIDLFVNESNRNADVILPAHGFAEKEGTATNIEGRVQKLNAISPGPGRSRPDWAILSDIASRCGVDMGLASAETIAKEIAENAPAYEGVTWDMLEWDERDGVVVPLLGEQAINHIPVALQGPSAPGAELILHVARTMYDDAVMTRHSPSLALLAPGAVAYINPETARRLGAQEGHLVVVVTKHGDGEYAAVLDEGTPEGVVYVPFNQPGTKSLGTDAVVRVTAVSP
jgi:predicted molibdopterin-dependent oxidoreductase YjgC